MNRSFLFLLFLCLGTAFAQQDRQHFEVFHKDSRLIEVVKPNDPPISKNTEPYSGMGEDEAFQYAQRYGFLENGEVRVYDRFYRLQERFEYRDGKVVVEEGYRNGTLQHQYREIPGNKGQITSLYYANGGLKMQDQQTSTGQTTYRWYSTGRMESQCAIDQNQETCDFWKPNGAFSHGRVRVYENGKVISELTLDINGRPTGNAK